MIYLSRRIMFIVGGWRGGNVPVIEDMDTSLGVRYKRTKYLMRWERK